MKTLRSARQRNGFTLIELLVSMTIIVLLLIILVSMTDTVRKTWSAANTRVEEFRGARKGFEALTRRLSDATLNTYWDYDNATTPTKYIRQSELRFLSGPGVGQIDTTPRPTHAAFFQAPFGFAVNSGTPNLSQLLNTWGYFIEYGGDTDSRPAFLSAMSNPPLVRSRFRLMELMEPTEQLSIYTHTSGFDSSGFANSAEYVGTAWFTASLTATNPRLARPIADNIVALIILPMLAPDDQQKDGLSNYSLAPGYLYDSTGTNMATVTKSGSSSTFYTNATASNPNINPINQVPPVIQVTMVAVDEMSYVRFQPDTHTTGTMPNLYGNAPFTNAANYAADLLALEQTLANDKLNYRVFTTNVSVKSAKWSTNY